MTGQKQISENLFMTFTRDGKHTMNRQIQIC